MTDDMRAIFSDAVCDTDLHGSEIPSINLYLDQIISLIADCNAKGSARYRDRVLTKTMINNYSKEGLIKPIKGKKYTREQVLQMLYIYALKATLSIGEIKRLLYGVYAAGENFDGDALESCYERFLAIKQTNREECIDALDRLMQTNQLNPAEESDYFLTVLGAVSLSAYFKSIAEAMLEAHYPDPDAKQVKAEKPEKAEKSEKHAKNSRAKKKRAGNAAADGEADTAAVKESEKNKTPDGAKEDRND